MLDIGRNAIDVELQLQLGEQGAALGLPLASSPSTVITQYGPRIGQYVCSMGWIAERAFQAANPLEPWCVGWLHRLCGSWHLSASRAPRP
jgi:hypothetical protein